MAADLCYVFAGEGVGRFEDADQYFVYDLFLIGDLSVMNRVGADFGEIFCAAFHGFEEPV